MEPGEQGNAAPRQRRSRRVAAASISPTLTSEADRVTNSFHHVALRVSDISRAAEFYIGVLSAEHAVLPFTTDGPLAETITTGPAGVSFVTCMLRIGEFYLELFEFLAPIYPMTPSHPAHSNILHVCIKVDDVEATLARVELLGGRRLWPAIERWGAAQAIYVADPDGNVIELIDTSIDDVVEMTHEMFPATDPAAHAVREAP
jgi:catechol 2,3-dioxygenase-like lactoylglutathione lyase family enzyme